LLTTIPPIWRTGSPRQNDLSGWPDRENEQTRLNDEQSGRDVCFTGAGNKHCFMVPGQFYKK
jgi:hypothetical protein